MAVEKSYQPSQSPAIGSSSNTFISKLYKVLSGENPVACIYWRTWSFFMTEILNHIGSHCNCGPLNLLFHFTNSRTCDLHHFIWLIILNFTDIKCLFFINETNIHKLWRNVIRFTSRYQLWRISAYICQWCKIHRVNSLCFSKKSCQSF